MSYSKQLSYILGGAKKNGNCRKPTKGRRMQKQVIPIYAKKREFNAIKMGYIYKPIGYKTIWHDSFSGTKRA